MKIAVHGLGRMGLQIVRKLTEGEHEVIAHNRSQPPVAEAASYGATAGKDPAETVSLFDNQTPVVWLMLPAEVTEQIIREWLEVLPDGAIIINGANSDYRETMQLSAVVSSKAMHLVDIGVSGGIHGYERGFPLMVGCDDDAVIDTIKPILDTLAAPNGAWGYFGPSGSGNYVKMVHNAIEYGMMQSLAEGYRLLYEAPYPDLDLALAGDIWQHSSIIESRLNELTRLAVDENVDMDGVSGYVAESGEAKWALETAAAQGFELPAIQAAFDVRIASQNGKTNYATKVVAAQRNKFGGHHLNREGAA